MEENGENFSDFREFDDEVYEKIEKALDDVKNGRVYTEEEFDAIMKEEFPFLRDDYNTSNDKIIAEESEKYIANKKIQNN